MADLKSAEDWEQDVPPRCEHPNIEVGYCYRCTIERIQRIQADAIEWARQLYQNWPSMYQGNLIESYNKLLAEKRDSLM